jgi:hypothetical protein
MLVTSGMSAMMTMSGAAGAGVGEDRVLSASTPTVASR